VKDDYYRTPLTPEEVDQLNALRQGARYSWTVTCWNCGHTGVVPCDGCPRADEAVPIEPKSRNRKTYVYDWRNH
jgi:hypothetical protein